MPYTKQEIQTIYSLSPEDVDQKLTSANLPLERETYTDEEIHSSFVIDEEFNGGQASHNIVMAERSEPDNGQLDLPKKTRKAKKSSKSDENGVDEDKCLNISELLSLASDQETRISLKQAAQILESCGLPDKEQYTESECERFLEAAKSVISGGADVESDIESNIEEAATALDQSGNGLVSEMMRDKAKADADFAPLLYVKHLASEFATPEFHQNWHRMEEALKAQVRGKSQRRRQRLLGEIRVIPPSPSPLNALPGILDNGSTTD